MTRAAQISHSAIEIDGSSTATSRLARRMAQYNRLLDRLLEPPSNLVTDADDREEEEEED